MELVFACFLILNVYIIIMTMYISKNTFNQEQSTLTTDQNDKITALFSAYPFLVTILAVVILANRLVAACACEIKKLLKHITEVSNPDLGSRLFTHGSMAVMDF